MIRVAIAIGIGFFLLFPSGMGFSREKEDKIAPPRIEAAAYTPGAVCGRCHTFIYDTWKESLHSRSLVDPIFDAAYLEAYRLTQGKAKTFCLSCHAPTTQFTQDFDAAREITREGITCDFCHTIQGVKLAERGLNTFEIKIGLVKRGPSGREAVPYHEVASSPLYRDSLLCAGCHQYVNPAGVVVLGTYAEWSEGFYGKEGIPCQRCHMPVTRREEGFFTEGGRVRRKEINLHNIAGGSSVTQLKKMLKVKIVGVERVGTRIKATVEITNHGAGHRIPTGLPTKWLVLTVKATTSRGKVYQEKVVYRKVLLDPRGKEITKDVDAFLNAAKIASDNRIRPKETRREEFFFFVPPGVDAVVSAQVAYRYQPQAMSRIETNVDLDQDERVFGNIQ